jgi:hypothetical protein
MINDQPPIPPRRQLCDERCAGGLAVTACYTTKWDVISSLALLDAEAVQVWYIRAVQSAKIGRVGLGNHRNVRIYQLETPAIFTQG